MDSSYLLLVLLTFVWNTEGEQCKSLEEPIGFFSLVQKGMNSSCVILMHAVQYRLLTLFVIRLSLCTRCCIILATGVKQSLLACATRCCLLLPRLQGLLVDGLAMIDDGAPEGERLFWFPCLSTFLTAENEEGGGISAAREYSSEAALASGGA